LVWFLQRTWGLVLSETMKTKCMGYVKPNVYPDIDGLETIFPDISEEANIKHKLECAFDYLQCSKRAPLVLLAGKGEKILYGDVAFLTSKNYQEDFHYLKHNLDSFVVGKIYRFIGIEFVVLISKMDEEERDKLIDWHRLTYGVRT
jgi:hypothetical protein